MRATIAGLILLTSAAPAAFAQTMEPAPAAPMAAPAPAMPMASPAPAMPMTSPPTTEPSAMAPAPAPVAPPAPPPAPTDPVTITLISTLETVCMPAVTGGDMAKLSKAAGYHKSGDNYVLKRPTFQLTILAPGGNPQRCHVDIIHPIDPEAPAKPLVVGLHNWAAVTRGYTLYQNGKNVVGAQEITTRSWELSEGGKNQALVLTTYRKADGTPAAHDHDTSEMLYSQTPTPAG